MKRCGLILLTVTAVLASATIASADSIVGFNSVNDDWGDNHTISNSGSISTGNVVGVWQSALWADNELPNATCSNVDGLFGGITEDATIDWQQARGLGADGIVGTNTWGLADNNLAIVIGTTKVRYVGTTRTVTFIRPSSGVYTWTWNGASRNTSHPTPALGC